MVDSPPPDLANLQHPQGVHADYCKHTRPLTLRAKPSHRLTKPLEVRFTKEGSPAPSAGNESTVYMTTVGKALSSSKCELFAKDTQISLGKFKKISRWLSKDHYEFIDSRGQTILKGQSSSVLSSKTFQITYTDKLSGANEIRSTSPPQGRERHAILKRHFQNKAELRDEESQELLMTVRRKPGFKGAFSSSLYITIAPHFDATLAIACYLVHYCLILQERSRAGAGASAGGGAAGAYSGGC
ncbi:unnamed protein product [Sympodiomycopsis kandeliae]